MCPSKFEKRVLETIGKNGQNDKVAPGMLGVSYASLNNAKSRLFKRFVEDLEIMSDYYPIFERRLKTDPELYSTLRSLARKIRRGDKLED